MNTLRDGDSGALRFGQQSLGHQRLGHQSLAWLLSFALLFVTLPVDLAAQAPPPPQDQQAADQAAGGASQGAAPYANQTPDQLQRLVAPIALYPDSLVAQILAASTFPDEVVEADRWVQANPDLKGQALGDAVNQQPWDPSVKALTGFPSVLGNMDKNLSWTSSLGDAYYNQQQDVMNAIQVMRQKAQQTGNLKTTEQQKVVVEGPDIEIEPVDPDVVYIPAYDPWLIYGYPIVAWPGWYPYPGIWFGGPFLSFGIGFGIGWYGGFGWGWGAWGFDWHNHYTIYNNNRYYSRSSTFYNRNSYYRGGGERGVESNVQRGVSGDRGGFGDRGGNGERGAEGGRGNGGRSGGFDDRGGAGARPFGGDRNAARGFGDPRGDSGIRSGAFSGYDRGGETRGFSSRGFSSMGGGGFHGGGGGFHGGGGGRR